MKKYILFIAFLSLAAAPSFSQSMFSVSYDIGLPVGGTSDYIGKTSLRGFGVEGRWFASDNLSYGGSFNWAVFYEEFDAQEWSVDDTRTVYGRQFRYINSYPLMATLHYYFGEWDATRLYLGTGIGAQKIDQRTEFGIYTINENNWRFGFAPEVGVLIPVSFSSNINLSAKYQYAVKAGDNDAVSYLSFKIGLAFM